MALFIARLLQKGSIFFECLELTGSRTGANKNPKVFLLEQYETHTMQEKIVENFSNNNTRNVVSVKQEDSTGSHADSTCLNKMR